MLGKLFGGNIEADLPGNPVVIDQSVAVQGGEHLCLHALVDAVEREVGYRTLPVLTLGLADCGRDEFEVLNRSVPSGEISECRRPTRVERQVSAAGVFGSVRVVWGHIAFTRRNDRLGLHGLCEDNQYTRLSISPEFSAPLCRVTAFR